MADRSTLKSLFTTATLLLRAGGEHLKVIISPLVRYAAGPCCKDPGYYTNRPLADMGDKLVDMGTWLKEIAFFKRIRSFRILNPIDHLVMSDKLKKAAKMMAKLWDASDLRSRGGQRLGKLS
jgi:hypothetical protein